MRFVFEAACSDCVLFSKLALFPAERGEVQRSTIPEQLQELSSQWTMTFATIRRFQRLTPAACGAGEVALEGPQLVSACAVLTAEQATVPASSTRFTFCPREGDR